MWDCLYVKYAKYVVIIAEVLLFLFLILDCFCFYFAFCQSSFKRIYDYDMLSTRRYHGLSGSQAH